MTFDPDHTYRGKDRKEKKEIWDKLSETEDDRKYMDAMRAMRKMIRDSIANGDHKRKHNE